MKPLFSTTLILRLLCLPALLISLAFFVLPIFGLVLAGASGTTGPTAYLHVFSSHHLYSLWVTVLLSTLAVGVGLTLGTPAGLYLGRSPRGQTGWIELILTMPASFPGVVIGFLVIQLAGRQGLIGQITHGLTGYRVSFAYSLAGLLLGYVYFSVPRVVATVSAAARTLTGETEEAARSLGAGRWQIFRDVIIPSLRPALIRSAAIVFATSMSAFGTAYALGADIPVLPLVIYDDFVTGADLPSAIAASLLLTVTTGLVLGLTGRLERQK